MKIRSISSRFINETKDEDGELHWIHKKILDPESPYTLEIREGYINIYYSGGSILNQQLCDVFRRKGIRYFVIVALLKLKGHNTEVIIL